MFADGRFHKSRDHRRRYSAEINGTRAGIVTAWRPTPQDNFALNCDDVEKLLEFRRDGKFSAAFIVLASMGEKYGSAYIAHRDASELFEVLKATYSRTGQFGSYWLLREDFSMVDAAPADMPGW
jgi:hypothetical protein